MPLWRLILDELKWIARERLGPVKLVAAVVVAAGVLAALGPLTPGPAVPDGWLIGFATVLGIAAAIVADALLRRTPQDREPGDPLPALRAILAAATLLVGGTILVAYLLAAVGDTDPTPTAPQALGVGLAVDAPLFIGAVLLAVGVLASAFSARLRLPGALLILGLGMAIGTNGLGWVRLDDPGQIQSIAVVALVVILFEGGLTTTLDDLRRGAAPGLLLGTVGVAITAGITAAGAIVLLDLPASVAWLIGAIVASTDAAAVFELLRRVPLAPRLAAVLRVESGVNDPVAVLLTVGLLSAWQAPPTAAAWLAFGALQLIGGAAIGVGGGWAAVALLRRARLSATSLYPILALACAGITYGVAAGIGASGFLATYLAGIVLATELPRRRRAVRSFHTALAGGVEIGLFLMLGLLVVPSQLPGVALTALAVTALLTLVGRPLATVASLLPLGFSSRGIAAVSWLGMRGAVPIVLATLALTDGVPQADAIFNVVFFIVITSAVVQGGTALPLLRRLDLSTETPTSTVIADALPLAGTELDLVEVLVDEGSALADRSLRELSAPDGALVVAVVRADDALVPGGDTLLHAGDLLVMTTTDGAHGVDRVEQWARTGSWTNDAQ